MVPTLSNEHSPASAAPVKSPCINVCTLDAALGVCRGCLRTLAEITAWSSASDTERRRILTAAAGRRGSDEA